MAILAIMASLVTLWIDAKVGSKAFAGHLWAYTSQPDGARSVLSTIAGSMITVAGVTFSMTIASVSYAAGQLGPRLMTNFMRDRGNQFTLGTFIATFLYSLMVLRTVRDGSDEGASFEVASFVPQVSILCALALAIASTAVLIFFIHHVPESINASNITARIGRELVEGVEKRFPDAAGDAGDAARGERSHLPAAFGEQARRVDAAANGYIRGVDAAALLRLATGHGLVVQLLRRPGDFVVRGQPLMRVFPPERLDENQENDGEDVPGGSAGKAAREAVGGGSLLTRCRGVVSIGQEKTHFQDLRFLVDELVEIAARAVSPGINDPFTAITAIDWLRSGLTALAAREPLATKRFDDAGVLRVLAEPTSFEEALGSACAQLRPYVAADRNAALHLLNSLGDLAFAADRPAHRAAVLAEAAHLADATDLLLELPVDRDLLRRRLMTLQAAAGSFAADPGA